MVVIKKIGDDYFLCKKKRGLYKGIHNIQEKFTNIFRIRADWYKSARINLSNNTAIHCPKELLGRKIMLKVVVVEDKLKINSSSANSKLDFKFEDLEGVY